MRGEITRLIHIRGFGFIRDTEGNERFFHARDLLDIALFPRLQEGTTVEFEPICTCGDCNGVGCAACDSTGFQPPYRVRRPSRVGQNQLSVSRVRVVT